MIRFTLNGNEESISIRSETPLLYVLRNDFELNGPKFGCGLGECGACTVLVDGMAARSCVLPVNAVEGRSVVTLEGLADEDGLNVVQLAFIEEQGTQCGYCVNGIIMTLTALLQLNPHAGETEIRQALQYNLCRCGAHIEIMNAALRAAELTRERQDA